ncbi:sec-independent protein translocase protein TatA [Ereboglobus sp. PH5-5]|uniref:Sec-independent protein translocase subunit TatA/TatB n=1 Tax=unclassified Ereboglobus TaxID=2626932 RepID=UPI0024075677|nr:MULTISPECIES: twin-arginine translocase TatA/TatE family subunit [unclassified Ereboglobus]MDF9827993.1 sec-independent protein translocase protein TatA [Ereboglobus sp. PH5-10]MDF9832312.1 sec-independent protein translocase protein TatA [Ereboglobus sp. PH5-5]
MNSDPSLILAVFGLGATELVIIFAVLLLLFGGAKLPSLAKGLGQSIREFKKASAENDKDEDEDDEPEAKKTVKKKADDSVKTNGSN